MRIAFIKQRYVPFGGGEGYLERLMKGCSQEGHEVHLITTDWSEGDSGFALRVHPVRLGNSLRSAKARVFAAEAAACVSHHDFDVVFSLERTNCQQIWRGGEGVHRTWLRQRSLYEPALKTWWNDWNRFQRNMLHLERECIWNTPFLIANSEMVKRNMLETFPGLSGEIHVIHNGYDADEFSLEGRAENRRRMRADLGLDDSVPVLLFPGSGFRRKGLLEMLEVLRELPEYVMLVVGRDRLAGWKLRAARFGVAGRVRFLVPRRNLRQLYHAVDTTVLPSWYDPFGNVGVESLACGTPLVSTAFTGASELIQAGLNGVRISRPDAIGELADAIRQSVALSGGERIAQSVTDYSIEHNVRKTLAVVDRAAAFVRGGGVS